MAQSTPPFEVVEAARRLGENVRTARVRRSLTQDDLAKACKITRKTLYGVEKGSTAVSVGTLLSVLWALGLLKSADRLADPEADEHGKVLEAAHRPMRIRNPAETDTDF